MYTARKLKVETLRTIIGSDLNGTKKVKYIENKDEKHIFLDRLAIPSTYSISGINTYNR